jgi:predicted amidohydrolase
MRSEPFNLELNLKKARRIIDKIFIPFDYLLLPEMFGTGYSWEAQILKHIDEEQQIIEEWLKTVSKNHNCSVIAGIGRKTEKGEYKNAVSVFEKGTHLGYYDKTHLFRGEKERFSQGNHPGRIFRLGGVKCGISICYEIGMPEVSRKAALNGAEILFMPFAFGRSRYNTYNTLTKARAIENGLYVVCAATPGGHQGFDFLGHSRIISPSGDILCDALDKETWIAAEYDSEVVRRFQYEEDDKSSGYYKNFRKDLFK